MPEYQEGLIFAFLYSCGRQQRQLGYSRNHVAVFVSTTFYYRASYEGIEIKARDDAHKVASHSRQPHPKAG